MTTYELVVRTFWLFCVIGAAAGLVAFVRAGIAALSRPPRIPPPAQSVWHRDFSPRSRDLYRRGAKRI